MLSCKALLKQRGKNREAFWDKPPADRHCAVRGMVAQIGSFERLELFLPTLFGNDEDFD